ncbi:MAG: FAD-dependent oxidoreductase [Myxococcales bacterium]|nr:FAD-dependent oxidoreductase [Myxococcales bacterium]
MASSLPKNRTETTLHDKKPRYTAAEARAEAERCLYCADAPCIKACPTEIDIPTFIKKIASGNVLGSATTIFEQNLLGTSCARVCPVEVLCVGDCVYNGWNKPPIQIGRLQRFATETATEGETKQILVGKAAAKPRRVACIGAGPASLAFAGTLALAGHKAVLFEKRAVAGGLNTTGIAPYKLHAHDALDEVEWVRKLGVEIRTGEEVSTEAKAKELLAGFDAVYLGVGLGADSRLGIPGEDGPGVRGAVEWIEEMKLGAIDAKALGRVLVIGGGNTAIDVARECALLGAASVSMVYRRTRADMSGYAHEMQGARIEGVTLIEGAQPAAVVRDAGRVTALRVAGAGGERELPCDTIIVAIGQGKLSALAALFAGVATDKRGCIVADLATGATGNAQVFAGGDCINGGKEVVNAVADGRNAARHLAALWLDAGAT